MHAISPAFLYASQCPHVVRALMHAVGACNGVIPVDEVNWCLVVAIGEAVPMQCVCIIK